MPDSFAEWRLRAEAALQAALPSEHESPERLHAAMRYAVLGGGKRLRPLLVYAAGTLGNADAAALDAPAAAVELVHAFSLVHDDLPAMDDDDLRRGRATVHIAFDEATAILAGDALQTLAFSVLADAPVADGIRVAMLRTLADASGARGMCGGQALDIAATGMKWGQVDLPGSRVNQPDPITRLERLHSLKTGALIRAAVRMGGLVARLDEDAMARLDDYAAALGLAFQIRDDILDVEGDTDQLGKTAGKDAAQDKTTYPALVGLDASKARLAALAEKMRAALGPLDGRADGLRRLAEFAVARAS